MKEQFYRSPNLSPADLKTLMQRSNSPALIRFSIQWMGLLLAVTGLLFAPNWYLLGLSLLAFGLLSISLFATTHECAHNTAFASRKLNNIVLWLVATAGMYTPSGFREFHFAHHRHTHEPGLDPEISIGGKPGPAATSKFPIYFAFLSGIPILIFKGMVLLAASFGPKQIWPLIMPWCPPNKRARLRWEARFVLAIHISIIAIATLWVPSLFWFYAGHVLGHSLLSFFLAAEHNGLPHEGNVLDRTRTTQTNGLIRFLMWNMPFHAAHHAYPGIPFHALPQLHELMRSDMPHISPGYPIFHREVVASLSKGKPFTEKRIK